MKTIQLPSVFGILVLICVAGAIGTGCQSVANPFVYMKPDYSDLPVDALQALAVEIETAVQEGNRNAEIADRDGLVLNESVRQAIRTRAARSELLNQFRSAGYGLELRKGLIEIVRNKSYREQTTSKERDRNAILVMSENEDRWTIYEGIRDASNLPPRTLSAIQETFYKARVQAMPAGQLTEDAAGQ